MSRAGWEFDVGRGQLFRPHPFPPPQPQVISSTVKLQGEGEFFKEGGGPSPPASLKSSTALSAQDPSSRPAQPSTGERRVLPLGG